MEAKSQTQILKTQFRSAVVRGAMQLHVLSLQASGALLLNELSVFLTWCEGLTPTLLLRPSTMTQRQLKQQN